jgi:hypothetical protein
MTTQHLNIDQMKDSMRAPWIAGDFVAMAREMGAPEAESFVARMELASAPPSKRFLCFAFDLLLARSSRSKSKMG